MAAPMNDFELQRQLRLEENRRRMEELGLLQQKSILESFAPSRARQAAPFNKPPKQTWVARRPRVPLEPRRSSRLQGDKVDYCEIGDNDVAVRMEGRGVCSQDYGSCGGGYHELLDLMERGTQQPSTSDEAATTSDAAAPSASSQPAANEIQEQLQQIRCSSQGRGSVYDSSLGITCHFCRQKKLCGEENCPRCQRRDSSQECIGKTNCSKCCSAFGKFCRACLLIRYGQTLEEVRAQMAAGTWLCPHCYEEENPDAGWICNSSICMKRRGLKPTGIAIYDAQERGFKSVGHLLQAQLAKKGGIKALTAAAAADEPPAAAPPGTDVEAAAAPTTTTDTPEAVDAGPRDTVQVPAAELVLPSGHETQAVEAGDVSGKEGKGQAVQAAVVSGRPPRASKRTTAASGVASASSLPGVASGRVAKPRAGTAAVAKSAETSAVSVTAPRRSQRARC